MLCIGLVVDDAIVVVENVQRRIDLGEPPLVASKRGTTQVAFAVIATTAVLVAVFLPVGSWKAIPAACSANWRWRWRRRLRCPRSWR